MTDEELVKLAQSGDRDAETELLVRYKETAKAKSTLYFMLGAEPDDMVQEAMIGLFKAIGSYDESKGASFKTFSDICMNRQMLTAVKSSARKKHAVLNEAVSLDKPAGEDDGDRSLWETMAAGSSSDPESSLIADELFKSILGEDSKLFSPMEHKVLLQLMDGKDYISIAEQMNKNPKQIDNAIQRIRKKLTKLLNE